MGTSTSACTEEALPGPSSDPDIDTAAGVENEPDGSRPAPAAARTLLRANDPRSLYPSIGTPAKLELDLADRAGFSGSLPSAAEPLNVGRFIARIPGGIQESIPADGLIQRGETSYTFKTPGAAVLMLCIGPDGSAHSDAWQRVTYCNTTVYRVADASGKLVYPLEDPGIMTKAGNPIEVLPIFSPLLVGPGDDFAVRVFLRGKAQKEARVSAIRPDGSVDAQRSNRIGLAIFRISEPGRWVIRYHGEHEGREVIGEFVFDVVPPQKGALR